MAVLGRTGGLQSAAAELLVAAVICVSLSWVHLPEPQVHRKTLLTAGGFFLFVCLFQNLSEKLSDQEMQYKSVAQEQLDNFTLDINTAYAKLRGIEQAVESECGEIIPALCLVHSKAVSLLQYSSRSPCKILDGYSHAMFSESGREGGGLPKDSYIRV